MYFKYFIYFKRNILFVLYSFPSMSRCIPRKEYFICNYIKLHKNIYNFIKKIIYKIFFPE